MKNSEQPAFPASQYKYNRDEFGLTKREYYAAMAMQGWIACQSEGFSGSPEEIAKKAVVCADALQTELEK